MALGPGSIAFVGFNGDGTDNLAFVALADLANGAQIFFTDNEWDGSAFNTGETKFTWTATSDIAAGTIVTLNSLSAAGGTSNLGSIVYTETANFGIGNNDETIYAYVGTTASPIFLAAVANGGFAAANGVLTNTGLTQGTHAINIGDIDDDADIGAFTGTRAGQGDFSNYLSAINNTANWIVQDAAGDQSIDTIAPDVPFSTTAFSINGAQTAGFAAASVSVSHAEGNTGTTDFTFTIQRTGGTVGQVDFSGTISAGTTDAADFGGALPANFSGSIADGASSASFTIHVSGDVALELDESFGLTLTNATNASATVTLGTTAANGIIQDDDTFHGVDLSTYVRIGRYDLPEPTRTAHPVNSLLAQEASGVAYDWDTDTLFIVGDGGTSVTQVTKTGQLIDSMTLALGGSPQGTEFYDTEGITYIGGGQFVMTEERDRQAVQFTYAAGTTLTRDLTHTVKLGTTVGNIGLEGLTYDPLSGGYIFVKETGPLSIFQTDIDFVAGTATNGSPTTVNSTNLFDPALAGTTDFSDVYSLANIPLLNGQPDGSHLIIISQESGKIVEVDRSGNVYSALTITADPGNPLSVPDQTHEGVTMDRAGNLYVVSENGGGDSDHPQLWVYARSTATNLAPTALVLSNQVNSLPENSSTAARIKVADVSVTDDGLGTNNLSLTGADANFFQVDSTGLYIKAGTVLDFETKASYAVTVNVDDLSVGATPDASTSFSLNLTDVVNETPGQPVVFISEVSPWSSGNSVTLKADWFEVTNSGNAALNITGWKVDDNSNSFGSSVALSGITSIAPGESVIFIETGNSQTAAGNAAAFVSEWFHGSAPAGLQIGSYGGSGIGLSTGGDAVNLFTSGGALVANVTFGISPGASPFATFDNSAGLDSAAITLLSAAGQNNAFSVTNSATTEIGSPGTVGKLFISEVAPWSSGNSPIAADWFEVTNTTTSAVNISGWKVDDSSNSFGSSVALNGITSIGAGESVIFIETSGSQTAAGNAAAFVNTWFGGHAPAGLQIGSYGGSGIGLSTGGDALNLYNSAGVLQANVVFGANAGSLGSPPTVLQAFDNAAGLNNTTISNLSTAGHNAAYGITHGGATETGSPGEITPVNDAPIAADDSLSSIAEDSGVRSISFANLTGNDLAGPPGDSGQTLTIVSVGNAVGGAVSIVGSNVQFAPALNYNGPASFDYTVQDNGTAYGVNHFLADVGSVSFAITPVNDPPSFTSFGIFSIAENHTAIGQVTAQDPESDSFAFSITGGADQGLFTINPNTGALAFLASPDFETPLDANPDNVYLLDVTATDQFGAASTQNIQVTVTDLVEPGVIVNGTIRNDVLTGSTGADTLNASVGNDRISGGDGNDSILGGTGNDTVDGGNGNDSLSGGSGNDSIGGGLGDDSVNGGGNNDHIDAGSGDNVVLGEGGNDTVFAGDGNDSIDGGAGYDVLTAGNGNNTVVGDDGNDTLAAGSGNDLVLGGDGADRLSSGDGDDTLVGGNGKDVLTGGTGADVFLFGPANAANADTIIGFEVGVDTLQFAASDFGLAIGVLDAANFVFGTNAVDHHAEFVYGAAQRKLMWDADGVGGVSAITVATFDTAIALTHADLIFV